MSLEEIKQAVIDEFKDKLTDVNNQISAITTSMSGREQQMNQLDAQLGELRRIQQTDKRDLNELERRRQVLTNTITKLSSGDIVIKNK